MKNKTSLFYQILGRTIQDIVASKTANTNDANTHILALYDDKKFCGEDLRQLYNKVRLPYAENTISINKTAIYGYIPVMPASFILRRNRKPMDAIYNMTSNTVYSSTPCLHISHEDPVSLVFVQDISELPLVTRSRNRIMRSQSPLFDSIIVC